MIAPARSPTAAESASESAKSTSAPSLRDKNVGVKEVSDKIWLVSFMKYDFGFFDQDLGTVTSA